MPEPFFSGAGAGAPWYQAVMGWNQDRGQELNRPQDYGLLGGDPNTAGGRKKNLYHQDMIGIILSALLSNKGMGAYRGAQVAPAVDPLSIGKKNLSGKTREEVLKEQQDILGI